MPLPLSFLNVSVIRYRKDLVIYLLLTLEEVNYFLTSEDSSDLLA